MNIRAAIQPNPYTPGAGDRLRALVGRSDQLALAESVRSQLEAGYAANSLIYVGLRGIGKTVLLKEIADRLARAGWYVPYLELRRGLAVDVALGAVADRFAAQLRPGAKLTRRVRQLLRRGGGLQVLGSGATVASNRPVPAYDDLAKVLATLSEAAHEDGLGVALIVDELQAISLASLGALVHVAQNLRDRLPFAFIGAGLPHLPSYIAKAATYTERFRYEPTDNLHDQEARAAVLEPAAAEGVGWDDDALAKVVAVAGGIHTSSSSTRSRPGRRQHAPVPSRRSLSRTSWQANPSRNARSKLESTALASKARRRPSGRTCSPCLISWTLKATEYVPATSLGCSIVNSLRSRPRRDALIRKGIVHAPEHGLLAFSIPGFEQYIVRRRSDEA